MLRLEARCRERQGARLRGHEESIGERLVRDRAAMLSLPAAPYEACERRGARVSSLALVRYRGNDYSVPVAYGHREVLVRGYVEAVVIACGAEVIARHRRSYEREDVLLEPLHYLPLLERKVGALDQAAPLAGWDLPEPFLALRRLLETRLGKAGRREWVQVLRLLEVFRPEEVAAGVGEALRLGAIGFDAVKHLVLCRIERRPPRLDLEVYPYLPRARVAATSARSYLALLAAGGRGHERGGGGALGHPAGAAGAPPQGAEAAELPARAREAGPAVRGRGGRPSALPPAPGRV